MRSATPPFSQSVAPPRGHSSLAWFVALSLLLHLPLLLTLESARLDMGSVARSLQLTLVSSPATSESVATPLPQHTSVAPPAQTRPTRHAKPARSAAAEVTPPAPTLAATTTPKSAITKSPATESSAAAGGNSAAEQAVLTVRLQQALARHFSYPLLARKKGWEGEVMLAFRIAPDGTISGARIARSSGYGTLDRAALGALNKVGRIDDAPRQGLSLEIPIIYRLQEG